MPQMRRWALCTSKILPASAYAATPRRLAAPFCTVEEDAARSILVMYPLLLERLEWAAAAAGTSLPGGGYESAGRGAPCLGATRILACPCLSLDEDGFGTTSVYALRLAREGEASRSASGVARLRASACPEIYATALHFSPNGDDEIFEFEVWGNAGIAGGEPGSVARLAGVPAPSP